MEQILPPYFLPRSSAKILETRVHGIPRSSSNFRTVNCQSSLIADCTHSTYLGVLIVEGLPEHGSLSTDSWPSLKYQYYNFCWASPIESSPKAFLIIRIVSRDGCPSLKQNLMQIRRSTCSVIVNAMVIQYTSSLNGVSLPNY